MMNRNRSRTLMVGITLLLAINVHGVRGDGVDPTELADVHGGLIVQLGASDVRQAAKLSLTGRYLIHVLEIDSTRIEPARSAVRKDGRYGLAWVEHADTDERLPYAENLVNLIVVSDYAAPLRELMRVLTPGGRVVVSNRNLVSPDDLKAAGFDSIKADNTHLVARKPWPKGMDVWSHPRHAADGNAVSNDTLVGPPDRVRWVAAASSEVEGMVTAGGRNFYGRILARDSFNGLRLWHRDLRKRAENNPDVFSLPKLDRLGARPVASDQLLFAVLQDKPVAMNAATGEIAVEFGDMTKPKALIHAHGRVVAADATTVRAFDPGSGKQLWKVAAANPRNVITDGNVVSYIQGELRRGDKAQAVTLDASSGKLKWQRSDYTWLAQTTRTVLAKGRLVFEVSTFNDHDKGNSIHVVAIESGKLQWSKHFPPGMNHRRQARAMFLEDDLWILHGGKTNTADKAKMKREPVEVSALNPATGETRVTYRTGLAHCFPPVATANFMFAGELDMTDLKTGKTVANRITKANCSSENGWVPANGLVYTTPKHCTCWPMLRGFVAMAPTTGTPSEVDRDPNEIDFQFHRGTAKPDPNTAAPSEEDWPLYRNDRWRSGSTSSAGPAKLNVRWSVSPATTGIAEPKVTGPIIHDWKDNPVIKGPLSAPTIANGLAYVTRPDAHELVAIDTDTGSVRWRFTATGRLDTPPAIHKGLALFGSSAGWVYALRADTGELVWKLRAAPSDRRIVAYGQVESPWPVPGAVLAMDGIAYFAAGRQPLADGGILVFAVDAATGKRHWVKRVDSVPQKGFYENSGLEFDPFDILHAEGDGIAMSRWLLTSDGKSVSVDKWNAFAKLNTGNGEVWIPRGSWTYGARHQHRFPGEAPRRPLIAFRDDNVFSSLNGTTTVFRRDFDLDKGEKFNSKWITGWAAASMARKDGKPYRTYRIAEGAKWSTDPFSKPGETKPTPKRGTQLHNRIHAMALASDDRMYVVHQDGRLKVLSTTDGRVITESQVPPPAWDGLAIAENRLFLTTQSGELICIGE